ncbi:MAG TPA: hypothetical protein VN201_08185 [Roseateles sp.]|nr:hypothetical protein [Roseateles sp.]
MLLNISGHFLSCPGEARVGRACRYGVETQQMPGLVTDVTAGCAAGASGTRNPPKRKTVCGWLPT